MDIDGKLYCPRCMRIIEREGPCPHCGHGPDEPRPPMALEPGTLLNRRYQLGSVIGQGGFGITYAAWDETLGMPVAIKEYFPSAEAARNPDESDDLIPLSGHEAVYLDGLNRFRRESNLLASLQGIPCVVKVLDFFSENETAYLVMEFVHGVPVDQWVREEKIKPRDLIAKLRPVLDALVRTHSQGVIHRDITPDNLLVTEDGSFRLIDFGSAVEVERSSGTIVLTRKYAPIEQYGREYGALGPWTDVYGLAAVIYELVSGQEPMESPLRAHHDEMKPLARMKTGLKRTEAAAITDALTVAPEKRTQSMAEFRARLYNLPLPEEVRKRKRFIRRMSVAAVVLLLLAALVVANYTTGLPLGNGLLYSFVGDGIYIVRELNRQEERELPKSVIGIPVKGIKADAFRGDETLTRVTIPGNVKKIEDTAFYGCDNLKEATIAEGVEEIGLSAFGGCNQMLTLTVPDTVTAIGEGAISPDAPELTVWGSRGSAAETYAKEKNLRFADAAELTWTVVGNRATITSVQSESKRLTLPNYVEGVPVTAIQEGVNLLTQEEVWLPEYLEVVTAGIFHSETYSGKLSSVRLGAHITEIGDNAFRHCLWLEHITLPETVVTIGAHAFDGCSLEEIHLPEGLFSIGTYAFAYNEFTELRLPDSLTDIGEGAFAVLTKLESVSFPSGITSLPKDVLTISGLKTVVLPEGIREIGESAFSGSALEWISLPDGLETIKSFAFSNCSSLCYVGIPKSVTFIDSLAFSSPYYDLVIAGHADTLAAKYAEQEGLYFEDIDQWTTPDQISNGRATYFEGREEEVIIVPWYDKSNNCLITDTYLRGSFPALRELVLPRMQTIITRYSITSCPSLEQVRTLGKITEIEEGAFFNDTALRVFPFSSVEYIQKGAFLNCISMQGIRLPDELITLGNGAFDSCESLTYAVIPGRVREIFEQFHNCDHLELVIFCEGFRELDHNSFWGCERIRSVWLPSTMKSLPPMCMDDSDSLTDLWVYSKTLKFSFLWCNDSVLSHLTIHGYAGSTAEAWAEEYSDKGVQFEPIPDGESMPFPEEIIASFEFYE